MRLGGVAAAVGVIALLQGCAPDIVVLGEADALVGKTRGDLVNRLGSPSMDYPDEKRGGRIYLYQMYSSATVPGFYQTNCLASRSGYLCAGSAQGPMTTSKACNLAFRVEGDIARQYEPYGDCK